MLTVVRCQVEGHVPVVFITGATLVQYCIHDFVQAFDQ